jgi:cell shape-determining protein MreC
MREDYVALKEDAKLSVTELIARKYDVLINNQYLDHTFDFYGMSFRLQAHERKKIAKNKALNVLLSQKENLSNQVEQLMQEIDSLKFLLSVAEESELKAKED